MRGLGRISQNDYRRSGRKTEGSTGARGGERRRTGQKKGGFVARILAGRTKRRGAAEPFGAEAGRLTRPCLFGRERG